MVRLTRTIQNKIADLESVRELVNAMARDASLSEQLVFDISVVLDELLSNIIKYGYKDSNVHDISISLSVSEGWLEIVIEDDGSVFDPLRAPKPDLTLPLSERPIGGLGLHFVRHLMDHVSYSRKGDRNLTCLKKQLY